MRALTGGRSEKKPAPKMSAGAGRHGLREIDTGEERFALQRASFGLSVLPAVSKGSNLATGCSSLAWTRDRRPHRHLQ